MREHGSYTHSHTTKNITAQARDHHFRLQRRKTEHQGLSIEPPSVKE